MHSKFIRHLNCLLPDVDSNLRVMYKIASFSLGNVVDITLKKLEKEDSLYQFLWQRWTTEQLKWESWSAVRIWQLLTINNAMLEVRVMCTTRLSYLFLVWDILVEELPLANIISSTRTLCILYMMHFAVQ